MFEEEEPEGDRRVYVNDKAVNDSLRAQVLRSAGVKFILQPGKPYVFSVTTARTSDVLDVYSLQGSSQRSFKKIQAFHDGTRQIFTLTSPLTVAGFYRARLLTGASTPPVSAIQRVDLESEGQVQGDTLRVKLFFMQSLRGLPTEASKATFAAAFVNEMNNVLKPYSVVVAGIHESVDPTLGPLVFPFSNIFVPLAGTRVLNHASLYLVDSISVGNPDTGPQGEVLGFSAREVVDISEHRESRVILANRASIGRLAVTAVHELGHFFGMRHTVSTRHDMLQDRDNSNIEDGFTDTRFCVIDQASLAKTAAAAKAVAAAEADGTEEGRSDLVGPYCLRIADNSCTEITCDLRNLMHPVECGGLSQTQLTAQQIAFLKRNMALYRR